MVYCLLYHSVFLGVAPESQCLKLRWCNVWLHVKCMTQRAKLLWNFIFFVMFIQNRPIEVKTILTWHTESDKWNICLRIAFLCLSLFPLLYQYCMLFISAESIPSRNHVRVARLPSIHVGATLFQFSYWMRFQCLYLHLAKSCIKDLIEIYRKYTRDRAYC